jgi:hypothetical protein
VIPCQVLRDPHEGVGLLGVQNNPVCELPAVKLDSEMVVENDVLTCRETCCNNATMVIQILNRTIITLAKKITPALSGHLQVIWKHEKNEKIRKLNSNNFVKSRFRL